MIQNYVARGLIAGIVMCCVVGCSTTPREQVESQSARDSDSAHHLTLPSPADVPSSAAALSDIPPPVAAHPPLPAPLAIPDEVLHTVVVYDVPVRELLFSLARDAGLNIDLDAGIDARVTINAVDQPLTTLLNRIASAAALRYRVDGDKLTVERDLPFLRNYEIDYLNIARTSVGRVAVSTQISSTGQGDGGDQGSSGNSSDTRVQSVSDHAFWDSLRDNVLALLNRQPTEAGETVASDVIVNRESGVVAVRATEREHEIVRRFIDSVQVSTQRQVVIEATIAEVNLSDRFQAGIDWSLVNSDVASGVEVNQVLTDTSLSTPPTFTLTLDDLSFGGNALQATLRALETFGDVSVMSSPKVMAMNNQTALLKVVDNLVYFTVDVNIDTSSTVAGVGSLTTFETEVNTVPVGFVMSVTPYISEENGVILNVRPTISRVVNFVRDPNPALADADVVSEIPVIQVREVESILRVASGDIAVIGGLMQDETQLNERGVPLLGRVPVLGKAFRYRDRQNAKSELVIFLKPTVVERASLRADLEAFGRLLPSASR